LRVAAFRVADLAPVDFRAGAFRLVAFRAGGLLAGALPVRVEPPEDRPLGARFVPPLDVLRAPADFERPLPPDDFAPELRLRCSAIATHY
jgi:hypothetical protein